MKSPFILLITLLVFSVSCSREQATKSVAATEAYTATQRPAEAPAQTAAFAVTDERQKVSLVAADKAELTTEAAERKIIRNADLTMEVASTTDALHRITSIAESHGGFVVTSEAKQRENGDPSKPTLDIKLVVRIPSDSFGVALDEIKQLASNLPESNLTGQDVTEDFIDLEARIKTQKALEVQFLEIMKQADSVNEALEVQRQISEVRTDIEKLEGRKRFLENRSSLSTLTVNLRAPKVITVNPTGFRLTLRDAVSDSLELASGMLIFFVRTVIVLVPIVVFIGLPAGVMIRYMMRRAKRVRLEQPLATPAAD